MSAAIFISYRRSDAAGHAGRLFDRLAHWFDADALFYDLDSIDAGDVFPQRLIDGIAQAKVLLVLIGPGWVDELNRRAGLGTNDYVRSEVEHALRRSDGADGLALIPVLLGGATLPLATDLAEPLRATLAPLTKIDVHTFHGKHDDWNHQFVRLRQRLATIPGVPAPRYRVPAGAEPPPFRVLGQSVSRHFSDPDHRLAELQRALESSGSAAVMSPAAIYGMGGVGKTQLALKYSHDYRDRYAGVWWLRAEIDATLQLDALDACHAVGAAVPEGISPTLVFKRWLERPHANAPPWLLVFDNAEDPAVLRPCLPERGGHHVLITSRNPAWGGIAKPVAAGVWSAEQGADFLAWRVAHHSDASEYTALRNLAEALGGLPLALEQAAGFLDETGMSVADYLAQVHRHDTAPLLLDEGRAATGYERSVRATLSIAFPRLDQAAAQLLRLLAFCAPEPVPESLFTARSAELLPTLTAAASKPMAWHKIMSALRRLFTAQRAELAPALAAVASQPMAWDKTVAALRRFGLIERTTLAAGRVAALQLHRLTQEVARHRLADAQADAGVVLGLLRNALPADAALPAHWPIYAALAPHVFFVESLSEQLQIDRRRLSWLLNEVATYLKSGPALYGAARAVFERALALVRDDLGEEHHNTLLLMNNLARTLRNQGDLAGARELQEQVFAVSRRVLGEEHPDTLTSMNNLASTLSNQGDLAGARELQEQVLAVRRRVLGEEHPATLTAMGNLAGTLRHQGDLAGARELQEQVLAMRRRVLGEEHPATLTAMGSLAITLGNQGDLADARELGEHVVVVERRVLGEEHPDTLTSMNNLAQTLWRAGERTAAVDLMHRAAEGTVAKLGANHPHALSRANALASMRATLAATDLPSGTTAP